MTDECSCKAQQYADCENPPQSRTCPSCLIEKPRDQFYANKHRNHGFSTYCKPCTRAKANTDWSASQKVKGNHRLREFGITQVEYLQMRARQCDLCAICGRVESTQRGGERVALSVDHDHATGIIRELLCGNCNRGIGLLRDDPELLERAAKYVRRHAGS